MIGVFLCEKYLPRPLFVRFNKKELSIFLSWGIFQELLVEYLFNDEMKANIIKSLNENVDVPFISEKTEAKILDAVYSSVEEVLKNAILKG